jgi:hypothetical protein
MCRADRKATQRLLAARFLDHFEGFFPRKLRMIPQQLRQIRRVVLLRLSILRLLSRLLHPCRHLDSPDRAGYLIGFAPPITYPLPDGGASRHFGFSDIFFASFSRRALCSSDLDAGESPVAVVDFDILRTPFDELAPPLSTRQSIRATRTADLPNLALGYLFVDPVFDRGVTQITTGDPVRRQNFRPTHSFIVQSFHSFLPFLVPDLTPQRCHGEASFKGGT